MSIRSLLALSIFLAAASAAAAASDPKPPPAVSKETAKEAVETFDAAMKAKEEEARLKAIEALGAVDHEEAADRLLKELRRSRTSALRQALFDALARQTASTAEVGPVVEKTVMLLAAETADRLKRGDAGFLIDRKTGDADVKSPEGRAALAESAAREQAIAAGFRCLLTLDYHKRLDADAVVAVLHSAEDELVTAALETMARRRLWDALPAVEKLYRMYPRENRWETGAVVDAGGTNATAKAAWMKYFGHPKKQTARPEVVKAIRKAILDMTGREVEDPAALTALLREGDPSRLASTPGR